MSGVPWAAEWSSGTGRRQRRRMAQHEAMQTDWTPKGQAAEPVAVRASDCSGVKPPPNEDEREKEINGPQDWSTHRDLLKKRKNH